MLSTRIVVLSSHRTLLYDACIILQLLVRRWRLAGEVLSFGLVKGPIDSVFDRLVEDVWQERNNRDTDRRGTPAFQGRTRRLDELATSILHSGVDGERGKGHTGDALEHGATDGDEGETGWLRHVGSLVG